MAVTYFKKSGIYKKTSARIGIRTKVGFSDPNQAGPEKLRIGKDFLTMICEEEDSNELNCGHDQLSTLNDRQGGLLGYNYSQTMSNVGNLRFGISVGARKRLRPSEIDSTSSDLSVVVSTKVIDKKESVNYSLLRKMEDYLEMYRI